VALTEIDGDQIFDGGIKAVDVDIPDLYAALPWRPTFAYFDIDGSKDDINILSTMQMIVTNRLILRNNGNIKVSGRLTIRKG
jgi:hypothetical protein